MSRASRRTKSARHSPRKRDLLRERRRDIQSHENSHEHTAVTGLIRPTPDRRTPRAAAPPRTSPDRIAYALSYAVLCSGSFEFSSDPRAALTTLAKHLRPGGRLVVLVPVANVAGWIYRLVQATRGIRPHLLSTRHLKGWALTLGMSVVSVRRPFPHCAVLAFRLER